MATVTIYPKTVTFNQSWDSSSGGPIEATFNYGGTELSDWTGDMLYPQTFVINATCTATVTLREVKTLIAPGTKDTLTFLVTGKSGADSSKSDVTVTMQNMVFLGAGPASQPRAAAGSVTLRFAHDSSDGSTAPVS
jgi:hypothetical protein